MGLQGDQRTILWTSTGLTWAASDAVCLALTDNSTLTTTNTAPTFANPSETRSVAENSPAGTDVGDPVTATDTDSGDTLTYTLEGTDAASFAIVSTSGQNPHEVRRHLRLRDHAELHGDGEGRRQQRRHRHGHGDESISRMSTNRRGRPRRPPSRRPPTRPTA